MGFFDSEEDKARRKMREAEQRMKSVVGAQEAHKVGHAIFQFIDLIDATEGLVLPMIGAFTTSREEGIASGNSWLSGATAERSRLVPVIQLIEEQGWQLIHAGHVFQETGSESRDKFLNLSEI